ncbi:hypothetical protein CsatA_002582 [Cannabis sativa]
MMSKLQKAMVFSLPKPNPFALQRYLLLLSSQGTETTVEIEPRKQIQQQSDYETTQQDITQVRKILHKRLFSSTEEVAQDLNRCGLTLSDSIVQHFLMRFSNEWILAFDFFNWAQTQTDYKHSPESYNLMVDILGKAKKFELLWDLIDEMKSLGDCYISFLTMTKVIRRLVRANMFKEAMDVFRGIERFGISKDTSMLNILMDSFVNSDSVDHAQQVFLEFKDSLPVNTQTFNILIQGWCKAGKVGIARKIMEEMERHGCQPNALSYTCLARFYCDKKDFRKLNGILNEMKIKDCTPTVATYTTLMCLLGKSKQINEALEIYKRMNESDCAPETSSFNSLIFILGKAGRLKDAEEVFNDMPKKGAMPDEVTFNTLIFCYCDHLQEEKALKLLQKMENMGFKPDLKTYAELLKMSCSKKRMKLIYFLLNHMYNNNISIDVSIYSVLISGLCKSERVEHACSFFKEMISKEFLPQDGLYDRLREALEAKNMVEEKEKIEKLMLMAKKRRTVS